MKKIFQSSLISALMASSFVTFAADSVTVSGGKLNFTGSVVAAPCAVDISSEGQTVDLGQVPTNRLVAKGDTSTAVPFTIKLTGCQLGAGDSGDSGDSGASALADTASYTSASITFRGLTTGDGSTLSPTAPGAGEDSAKGVGIQIMQNGAAVKVDGSTATTAQNIATGTNELPFSVAYVATEDSVVAGPANATVDFEISYQ